MSELRSRRFVYDRIEPHETSVRAFGDTAVAVCRGTFTVNGGLVSASSAPRSTPGAAAHGGS
jgi:hypothetical protein